ncbi:hypothetical protein ABIF74_011704 [Bradyrhizobium japonicum]
MQIHLQRIVGAYVGWAHGAGQLYSRAVTEAREATAKLANDSRDADLDGPASIARHSASVNSPPTWGVQAHALRMAAEGAVAAYEKVVGETWKPFERPVDNTTDTVGRALQLSSHFVRAVEDKGMSCRGAANRFGVAASNRLVARSLERAWEERLRVVEAVERDLATKTGSGSSTGTPIIPTSMSSYAGRAAAAKTL